MDNAQLNEILLKGEDSAHQFKESFQSIDNLAVEISAFANSDGGTILVGVSDSGEVKGIDSERVKGLNQWISNATTAKIDPPLFVRTHILLHGDQRVLAIEVPRGRHKPYAVNKSQFWVKNGADKRRATREELFRLMQSSRHLFADELETEAGLEELDREAFGKYYQHYYAEEVARAGIDIPKLLKNLKLMGEEGLTLAGLLLFGKSPQQYRPYFSIRATYFDGTEVSAGGFRDKEEIGGQLIHQFQKGAFFITRNLHRIQKGEDFNIPGEIEVPETAIYEAISNAIVHRDYFIASPIFIQMFTDRLEISSPGTLPNTLTQENIRFGVHIERNPILLSMLERDPDFRYTGRGTGIPRILKACRKADVEVDLIDDTLRSRFTVIFKRPPRRWN